MMGTYDFGKKRRTKEINKISEFRGITGLIIHGNYPLAIKALEEYLEKYPGNSYGIKEYSGILRQLERPEEALEILAQSNDNPVHIRREKAYSYMLIEEYEKALEEFATMPSTTNNIEKAKSYCRAKLNICSEIELSNYYVQQFAFYDEKKAIEYIEKNPCISFSKNISIEELFHNISLVLENATPVITCDFLRKYYFRIPQIGQYKKENVDYLIVITPPNSKEILTMVPSDLKHNVFVNNYEKLLKKTNVQEREFKTVHEMLVHEEKTLARLSLESYIKKYPEQMNAIKKYISLVENTEYQEEGFHFLEQYLNSDNYGIKDRIIVHIHMKEYQKALEEIANIPNEEVSNSKRMDQARNYIYTKTGRLSEISGEFYSIGQAKNYSKEKALSHIKLHLEGHNKSYFKSEENIEDIYEKLGRILPSCHLCKANNPLLNQYNFYLKEVGYTRFAMPVDYFKVVTLPNSFDILTMYPCDNSKEANDYEKLLNQKEKEKVKVMRRESQVEKFNHRYGKV